MPETTTVDRCGNALTLGRGAPPQEPPQVSMLSILSLVSEDETRLARDEAHIEALVADLRQRLRDNPGESPIQTPLRVYQRGDKHPIIAGNNRYFAAVRTPLMVVPCIVEPAPADEADLLIEQVKDNSLHHPYTQLEDARNMLKLVALRGCTQGEAARLLGIDPTRASKARKILDHFPADLLPLIGDGRDTEETSAEDAKSESTKLKVPFSCAYLMVVHIKDEAKIREFSDRFVRGLMTRDRLEDEIDKLKGGPKTKKAKPVTARDDGAKIEVPFEWGWQKLGAFGRKIAELAAKGEKHTLPISALQQLLKS